MRVYEQSRGGELRPQAPSQPRVVVTRKDSVIAEFDYGNEAFEYVQRMHDLGLDHLRIYNLATRAQV